MSLTQARPREGAARSQGAIQGPRCCQCHTEPLGWGLSVPRGGRVKSVQTAPGGQSSGTRASLPRCRGTGAGLRAEGTASRVGQGSCSLNKRTWGAGGRWQREVPGVGCRLLVVSWGEADGVNDLCHTHFPDLPATSDTFPFPPRTSALMGSRGRPPLDRPEGQRHTNRGFLWSSAEGSRTVLFG